MTPRSRSYALALALLAGGGMSCDKVTAPTPTGAIDVALVGEGLDSVRVTATGATTKTITLGAAAHGTLNAVLDGLLAGSYDVTVEGLIESQVARYGVAGGITVHAGARSERAVTLSAFQPTVATVADTVKVLHFTVQYSAVPHATSYIVAWSRSHTMADASSDTVTGTATEIVVPDEGRYYFEVRAVNATVATGGMPSDMQTVYALQSVATVQVAPPSPTIVDGATQQFTAVARDADNNILSGITLFWASSNNAVATVSQTGLVTSVSNGQAVISAVAKGVPGSATITVTPQAPTKLVFTAQPTNTVAAQSIASIKVAVQNPKNQTATSDNSTQITLAIGANPGAGVLSGTATATVVNGVASFDNISINRTGANYTLTANGGSLTSAASAQFNVTPGAPAALAFAAQPGATTAGAPISPAVQVEIRDAQGNRVTTARDAITIAIGTNPATGALSGTRVVNAIDGIASFGGISIDKIGTGYTLSATGASLPAAASSAFNIVATGTATRLGFSVQPANITADDNIQVTVRTEDSFGNVVSSAVPVTVSIGSNAAAGTLTGTTTETTTAGSTTFSNLRLTRSGNGYTLVASSGSLAQGISLSFNVAPGIATQVAFTAPPTGAEPQGPLGAVEVQVQDAYGNRTSSVVDVTVGIDANAGGGTLSGTTTIQSSAGAATFNDLTIDADGNGYTLVASAPGLASVTTAPFDVYLQFMSMSSGEFMTCGLTTRGSAYCWGENFGSGRLGNGQDNGAFSTPQRVVGGHTFAMITVGYVHACALRASDGAALCWGDASSGKLGNGVVAGTIFNSPQLVNGGHSFVTLAAGEFHTCGIRASDNAALCWGNGGFGRLGNNTITGDVAEPGLVDGAHTFRDISSGRFHTCAVRTDSEAYCWGRALSGRLGNNDVTDTHYGTPQLVQGGFTYKSISSGTGHTCAIRNDDRALCWGQAQNGKLGNGTTTPDVAIPAVLPNLIRYRSISAGFEHSCGVGLNSGMFCWGMGAEGRLGNGTLNDATRPLAVLGGLIASRISAGVPFGEHTCAVTTTGAFCWGDNTSGELGDGSQFSSSVPVRVKGSR